MTTEERDETALKRQPELKEVALRITEQGAVRVNAAHLHRASEGIAAVYVDLHSKRAALVCTGGGDGEVPSVTLEADEHTLHVDETKPRESLTTIEFADYVDWRVFAADTGRYTLAVCLIAPENPNPKPSASPGAKGSASPDRAEGGAEAK